MCALCFYVDNSRHPKASGTSGIIHHKATQSPNLMDEHDPNTDHCLLQYRGTPLMSFRRVLLTGQYSIEHRGRRTQI